nr:ulp1 protease family, C-terminal catalytic domain-containing protein [Ipomoea batatas]
MTLWRCRCHLSLGCRRIRCRKHRGDLIVDEDATFSRVSTRSPAGVLVDSLKDLLCQEKYDIREMGFAALLDFNVSECPPRLVYWLLSNFDGESMVFDLGGGRSLALEERKCGMLSWFLVFLVVELRW